MNQRLITLLLLLANNAVVAAPESEFQITKDNVATFYSKFQRLTNQPHYVAARTAALCRAPSPEMIAEERSTFGPHTKASVHIYASPLAADTLNRGVGQLPVGSIIVKEKLSSDGSAAGVGGMIKRSPGFNPSHGDWEYFYSAPDADFSIGRLQNCIDCHAKAETTDYTFRSWLKPGEVQLPGLHDQKKSAANRHEN